ncbi:SPOR domain-containing protein [Yoonia sediminilitoris]|uniref:Sporulation related protein n=1 Tax=Yoonia sediminilitoris TaxID=1286148 RepID=A0A2T6KC48_9RHOB|nr:SPOR domain-containing protein [Yoonia sediminilitoris]PUB12474.1 sporulation related protein [Yoonia sediminilitoris]RCW93168.1 sporulation related protein [Yoonia sediminilitoris]
MTGHCDLRANRLRVFAMLAASIALAGCDDNGNFAFPSASSDASEANILAGVPVQTQTVEEDVERPDIFEVSDRGLWDGRPSLGGAWVAHPDVTDPERALIRNVATGETIIGALFRRERENPGPLLQVSSDVADALGILAGAPTELYVVALRRSEVTIAPPQEPEEAAVIADLETPQDVETTPLDPIAGAAAAIDAAEGAATPIMATALPAAAAAPTVATDPEPLPEPEQPPVVAAPVLEPTTLDGPIVQIGIFSIEANANSAAARLEGLNIATSVVAQEVGGRTVWRVVAGVPEDTSARDAAIAQIKDLGFVDAFVVDS